MFGHRFVAHLRHGWRSGWRGGAHGQRSGAAGGSGAPHQARRVAAAAGPAGQLLTQLVSRAGLKLAGGAMVLGGGVTFMTREQQAQLMAGSETAKLPWVQALAAQPGMREVLVPGQQLRKHPVGQLVSEADHLVRRGAGRQGLGARVGGLGRSRVCARPHPPAHLNATPHPPAPTPPPAPSLRP